MPSFPAQINYFGTPISPDQIDDLLSRKQDSLTDLNRIILNSFFGIETENLSREILDRYAELSSPDTYHGIIPSTEKMIDRLFGPLKSAKRCYCFGEFLATIELSAHVAEMLAILLWEMSNVSFNGKIIDHKFEKEVLGRKFEKLGQENRIRVLRGFELLSEEHYNIFNSIRTIRTDYFHLWSGDFSKMQSDATLCYKNAMRLVKEILQIGISKENPGRVSMNPLLLKFMEKHGELIGEE